MLLLCLCIGAFVFAPVMAASEGTLTGTFRVTGTEDTPSVASDVAATANVAPSGGAGKNVAPKVAKITSTDDTVECLPGQQTHAVLEIRVTDSNGAADIKQISVQVSRAGQNYGSPIIVTQGIEQGSNAKAYTTEVPFEYYWPASSYTGQSGETALVYYTATVTAIDQKGASGTGAYQKLQYIEALGFSIDTPLSSGGLPTLDFGALLSGQSAQQTSTVHNTGNTPIALVGSATPWSPSIGDVQLSAETLHARGSGVTWVAMNSGSTIEVLPIGDVTPPSPTPIIFKEEIPDSVTLTPGSTYTTIITITGSRT